MNINGFELPTMLEVNLHKASYKLSTNQTTLLGEMLEWISNPEPSLYNHRGILRENRLWASEYAQHYVGTPNPQYSPGNIDPKLTLIIGDAEPDSPIALDYRTAEPRVIYFCDIERVTYWVELSPSYEALMKAIGPA